jgi:hypothetical protein
MSSSLLSEFGVNALARCSANRIDFPLVQRAQLLPGFLRRGMGTIGHLNFLLPSILNGRLLKVL